MVELQKHYNGLLHRYKKAEEFLDNPVIPIEDKEPHIPEFQGIINSLNNTLHQLKVNGISPTDTEILVGFKDNGGKKQ